MSLCSFWRKGGYATGPKAEEDYRWPIIRDFLAKHDPIHPLGREVFSLTFVAVYQHILVRRIFSQSSHRRSQLGHTHSMLRRLLRHTAK